MESREEGGSWQGKGGYARKHGALLTSSIIPCWVSIYELSRNGPYGERAICQRIGLIWCLQVDSIGGRLSRDDGRPLVLCGEVGKEGGGDCPPAAPTGRLRGRERGRPGGRLLEGVEGEEARGAVLPHGEQLYASAGWGEGRQVQGARGEGEGAKAGAVDRCGVDRGQGGEEEEEEKERDEADGQVGKRLPSHSDYEC